MARPGNAAKDGRAAPCKVNRKPGRAVTRGESASGDRCWWRRDQRGWHVDAMAQWPAGRAV